MEEPRKMVDPDVQAVCDEFEITIIPANVAPQIGQTRAPFTLASLKKKYGVDHMRFVVGLLAETENNKSALSSDAFNAVSDVILAFKKNYPHIIENETSRVYEFFDATPVGTLFYLFCLPLEGVTSKRKALVGLLWERAERKFGKLSQQPNFLDDRVTK